MLSIKSIASKLGFGEGVVEQASIVAGRAVKGAATRTYNGVSSYEYSNKYSEFKQEFANGRQSGKEAVNTKLNNKLNKAELQQLGNSHIQLITL